MNSCEQNKSGQSFVQISNGETNRVLADDHVPHCMQVGGRGLCNRMNVHQISGLTVHWRKSLPQPLGPWVIAVAAPILAPEPTHRDVMSLDTVMTYVFCWAIMAGDLGGRCLEVRSDEGLIFPSYVLILKQWQFKFEQRFANSSPLLINVDHQSWTSEVHADFASSLSELW